MSAPRGVFASDVSEATKKKIESGEWEGKKPQLAERDSYGKDESEGDVIVVSKLVCVQWIELMVDDHNCVWMILAIPSCWVVIWYDMDSE